MARPLGITVLSIALGWLALAGIGNAIVWNTVTVQSMLAQIPSGNRVSSVVGGPLFTVVAVSYALCAAAACIGLWRMRPWASKAYAAWSVTALLLGTEMVFSKPALSVRVGLLSIAALAAIVTYEIRKQCRVSCMSPPLNARNPSRVAGECGIGDIQSGFSL
jgi:uncharacterized membrane protein (DUF2068 family)